MKRLLLCALGVLALALASWVSWRQYSFHRRALKITREVADAVQRGDRDVLTGHLDSSEVTALGGFRPEFLKGFTVSVCRNGTERTLFRRSVVSHLGRIRLESGEVILCLKYYKSLDEFSVRAVVIEIPGYRGWAPSR